MIEPPRGVPPLPYVDGRAPSGVVLVVVWELVVEISWGLQQYLRDLPYTIKGINIQALTFQNIHTRYEKTITDR